MTLKYTYITRDDIQITTLTDTDGYYVEVPSILNDDNTVNKPKSNKLADTIYYQNTTVQEQLDRTTTVDPTKVCDTTYINGSPTRTDYAVGTDGGKLIVAKLKQEFSGEVASFDDNPLNLVGEYTAQRPPYNVNNSLSFYNFDTPTDEIKETYNATYQEYKMWYGLKFDTVTKDALAKFVIPASEMERVDNETYSKVNDLLPAVSYQFYARIHDKENNINENVDVYFQADPNVMEAWCSLNGHTFPYDINDTAINPMLFVWGCVYNTTLEEITHVKAYARKTAPDN